MYASASCEGIPEQSKISKMAETRATASGCGSVSKSGRSGDSKRLILLVKTEGFPEPHAEKGHAARRAPSAEGA